MKKNKTYPLPHSKGNRMVAVIINIISKSKNWPFCFTGDRRLLIHSVKGGLLFESAGITIPEMPPLSNMSNSLISRCAVTPKGQRAHIALYVSFYRIYITYLILKTTLAFWKLTMLHTTQRVVVFHSLGRSTTFRLWNATILKPFSFRFPTVVSISFGLEIDLASWHPIAKLMSSVPYSLNDGCL